MPSSGIAFANDLGGGNLGAMWGRFWGQKDCTFLGNWGEFGIIHFEMNTRGLITCITSRSIFNALKTSAAYPGSSIDIEFNCLISFSISGSSFSFIFLLGSLVAFYLMVRKSSSSGSTISSVSDFFFLEYLAFL